MYTSNGLSCCVETRWYGGGVATIEGHLHQASRFAAARSGGIALGGGDTGVDKNLRCRWLVEQMASWMDIESKIKGKSEGPRVWA